MDIGVRISGHRPAGEVVALARAAEAAGLGEIWLTEDYLERGIFTLAGAVAAATRHAVIGLGIVNPFTRHPALIAMEAAALHELAPGRVVLGLGASNEHWMSTMLGLDHTRPLAAVGEARHVIGLLLGGGPVDVEGERFRVHAELAFPPATPIPVYYGVKGPRGLDLARTDADGAILSVLSSPAYVRWVRERVGPDLRLASFVEVLIDDDVPAARDALRPFVARFLGMHGDQPITTVAGLDRDRARHFRQALLAGTPDVGGVTDDLIDRFVIAGDQARAAAARDSYAGAGLDCLVVGDRPERTIDEVIATAAALAS
jgi:5,10-methylenetetrahydromethanopterin reductase